MPAPLLVADAPALLYRAFFALPDSIVGSDGRPIGGVLGATNALLQIVERHAPRAVVCCFGQEDAVYRVQAFPGYHAKRPPMPDELARQFEQASELWSALGWRCDVHPELEADDLLGTLAERESAAGGRTLILTGDRDLFQCATDQVTILLQRTGGQGPEALGPAEVRERYGIDPAQVPDFIALRGDPSDGIPGAKGIGEKTAAQLLREHGTLDAIIDSAVRQRPAVRRALLEQADELRMFRDIATLRDAGADPPPDGSTDRSAGVECAQRLGMGRLAERLGRLDG